MILALLKKAFADYAWLTPRFTPDPPPNVGDVLYRFGLAAISYAGGIAWAVL